MKYQYPEEVLNDALEKGVSLGLFDRPLGEAAIAQTLAALDTLLTEAVQLNNVLAVQREEERTKPISVDNVDSIPFDGDDIVFIEARDQPDQDVRNRIHRREYPAQVICLIGPATDWARELIYTGFRVYELPLNYTLEQGRRLIKAHRSTIGTRWIEVRVGGPSYEFN